LKKERGERVNESEGWEFASNKGWDKTKRRPQSPLFRLELLPFQNRGRGNKGQKNLTNPWDRK